MEEAEGKKSSIGNAAMAILSTHPLSHKRMESLQQWVSAPISFDADPPPPYEPPLQLPEAMETRQRSGCPDGGMVDAFRFSSRTASSPSPSPFA